MKQFYLHDGQNQIGPFSSEELKEKNITRDTFVWKEGMTDWKKAGEVTELNNLFVNTPPPFKAAVVNIATTSTIDPKTTGSKTVNTGMWIGRNPKTAFFILILLVIAGVSIYNNQHSNSSYSNGIFDSLVKEKTPEELRMELRQKEKENPKNYLTSELTMRGNLIGEKVFEGTISNTASTATFKDVMIEISFLSKTESVISKEKFVVYEVLGPQKKISIKKYKTFAPNGTEKFSTNIISASPVE